MRIRKHIIKGRNGWNTLVPVLFICCSLISCSGRFVTAGESSGIDSLINRLDYLARKNDWDSLFNTTYPILSDNGKNKDTLEMLSLSDEPGKSHSLRKRSRVNHNLREPYII
ncbi:MAG: hypothetical protein IAB93_03700 [Bacteroidetes bacterium]|uniref:Uncharacterized protein n=1 Tax=Candidatus Merdivivens pullistercoris TaxID=2840873 RepID=A0A9D9I4H2_9BACT|nr:hypothetical protein [Candidatus Merdivivens pullistercoris]